MNIMEKIMKKTRIITGLFLTFCFLLLLNNANARSVQLVDVGNGIYKDTKTGLMWEVKKSHRFSSMEEVDNYLKGLKLGGFNDWRLPTKHERWELLHVFLLDRNGKCKLKRLNSPYWTTKTEKGTLPIRLEIDCYCRDDEIISYASSGYVRAVRRYAPREK